MGKNKLLFDLDGELLSAVRCGNSGRGPGSGDASWVTRPTWCDASSTASTGLRQVVTLTTSAASTRRSRRVRGGPCYRCRSRRHAGDMPLVTTEMIATLVAPVSRERGSTRDLGLRRRERTPMLYDACCSKSSG